MKCLIFPRWWLKKADQPEEEENSSCPGCEFDHGGSYASAVDHIESVMEAKNDPYKVPKPKVSKKGKEVCGICHQPQTDLVAHLKTHMEEAHQGIAHCQKCLDDFSST